MPALLIALAVVVGIQPGLIKAQSNLENRLNRIKLYNHCRPMELVVESPSPFAVGRVITEELLRWAAESRLRAARLYTDSSTDAGNRITTILNGQRGVTANTVLRLARYFGTTPEVWMNLQKT